MAEILTIRRYKRETFRWQGAEFTARIKRPQFREQAALKEVMTGTFAAMGALQEMSEAAKADPGQQAAMVAQIFRALNPDLVERTFRACVSGVEGLYLADDDGAEAQPITNGADLLDVADEALVVDVLLRIFHACNLSPSEGKGSASPSMSSPEGETHGSGSDATSTGGEAGQAS